MLKNFEKAINKSRAETQPKMYLFVFFANINLVKKLLLGALAVLVVVFAVCPINGKQASAASSAKSMIVIETSHNKVLYEQNAYQKLAMASTTKIMTAIVVLDYCRLNDIVRVDAKAVGVEGTSIYLQKDEELTVEQLLYGLMLQSGNDCAAALAIHTAGSVEEFANMMNDKAKRIGANDSNFVNPHGLDHKEHYTTAYDLAIIASYGMKNEDFKRIVGTKKVEIPWAGRDYNRIVVNKNKILSRYKGGTGIKTGYTGRAGRCLVSSAEREGMELICVVLNCGPMFEESMKYMDMMFNKYHIQTFIEPYQYLGETIFKNSDDKIGVYAREGFKYPVDTEEPLARYSVAVEIDENLYAPLKQNEVVGKIKVYFNKELIFSAKVYTISTADNFSYFWYIQKIAGKWNI